MTAPARAATRPGGAGRGRFEHWVGEHAAPLAASVATVVLGMWWALWWDDLAHHQPSVWLVPGDLWISTAASVSLAHGHFSANYAATPGALLLLLPAASLAHGLGLSLGYPFTGITSPTAFVVMGPFSLLVSCSALFAFDAAARRLGTGRGRRLVLALVGAWVLSNVTVRWGHPEDAVAVALAVYALLAADRGALGRAGWLLGAAVAVQPLALFALPWLAVRAWSDGGTRALAATVGRALVPWVVLLAPALLLDGHQAAAWLRQQGIYPGRNHVTPWTRWAAPAPGLRGAVEAGPNRAAALAVAAAVEVVVGRRHRDLAWGLWAVTAGFWVWTASDAVLDSYYTWPVLALVLVLASWRSWALLVGTGAAALLATWFSKVRWHGAWPWWYLMVGLLAALLVVVVPRRGPLAAGARSGRSGAAHPQ